MPGGRFWERFASDGPSLPWRPGGQETARPVEGRWSVYYFLKANNQNKEDESPINKNVFNERSKLESSKLVRLEKDLPATTARIAEYSTISAFSYPGTPFGKNG
jgi:hypothetical protein